MKLAPHLEWSEVSSLVATNSEFKAKFIGAKIIWQEIRSTHSDKSSIPLTWNPSSEVATRFNLGARLSRSNISFCMIATVRVQTAVASQTPKLPP